MSFILDNHLSHSVLKALLPKISTLFHDNNEVIRTKFLDLLIKVKSIKHIRYYDIVPLKELLARLGEEEGKPKKLITDLLLTAYFPFHKSAAEQISRCFLLLHANPDAAISFYSQVSDLASSQAVGAFMKSLLKFLVKRILATLKNGQLSNSQATIESSFVQKNDSQVTIESSFVQRNESVDESQEEKITEQDLRNSLVVIYTIWKKLSENGSKREATLQFLIEVYQDEHFVTLFNYFDYPESRRAIFKIAQFVPVSNLPRFSQKCFLYLQKATKEESQALVETLLRWNFGTQVLQLVTNWISQTFKNKSSFSGKKRSRNNGTDSEQEESISMSRINKDEQINFALSLLGHLFSTESGRETLFEQVDIQFELFGYLNQYFQQLTLEISEPQSSNPLLLLFF